MYFAKFLIPWSRRKNVFRGILISQFQKLKEKKNFLTYLFFPWRDTNVDKNSLLQTRTSHGFKFSTLFSLLNYFLLSIRQDFYVFFQRNHKTDFFFNFAVFRPWLQNCEIHQDSRVKNCLLSKYIKNYNIPA